MEGHPSAVRVAFPHDWARTLVAGLALAAAAWAHPAPRTGAKATATAPARSAAALHRAVPPRAPARQPAAVPTGPQHLPRWRPALIVSGDFVAGANAFNPGTGASLGFRLPLTEHLSLEPAVSLNWRSLYRCESLVLGCNRLPQPRPPETTITGALIDDLAPGAIARPFIEAGGGAERTQGDSPNGWRRVLFVGGGASLPTGVWGIRFRPEARLFVEHPLTGTPFQLMIGLSRTF